MFCTVSGSPVGRAQGGPVHRCVPFAESPLFLIPAPSLLPGVTSQMNHVHPNPVPSTALGRGGDTTRIPSLLLPSSLPPLLLSSHPGLLKLFFQPLIPPIWIIFTNGTLEGSLLKQFSVKNDLWPNTFGTHSAKQGPFASCLQDLSD